MIDANTFREYDIRGQADRDFPDASVEALGRAIGTAERRHGHERIAVGRDCRLSSDRIFAALVAGLQRSGVQVFDLGMVPTPLLYFAVHHFGLDGGVQITGSHNPPGDNGFKLMRGKGTLFGDDIRALRELMVQGDYVDQRAAPPETLDVLGPYEDFIRNTIRVSNPACRFAIDAGSGAGGPAALSAMAAAGLSPVALLCEPDGRFPIHHPDPTEVETLALLQRTVVTQGLALGIAYDGDADRLGVVDEQGRPIFGDRILIILARALLKTHPGATIIGEVKCSETLYDDIRARGGRPIIWKTGHSLIKAKMKEEGALLAGEMSGHIFYADRYFGFDDAIYASLRLLEIIGEANVPVSALLEGVPITYSTPEIRVPCADDRKFGVVAEMARQFRETHPVLEIDGARVTFEGGWGLVRASNTQPVLVLRFESQTADGLASIRATMEAALADCGV